MRRRWTEQPDSGEEPEKIKNDNVGQEDYMPTDDIHIPITVTIIIMGLYIFGGEISKLNLKGNL